MTIDVTSLTLNNLLATFLASYLASVPFLLVGVVFSGLIEEFVTREQVSRVLPTHPVASLVAALFLGVAIPVTDPGILPVSRRLFLKGLPASSAIALTLAGPTINLLVAATTVASYGIGLVTTFRLVIVGLCALLVGLIYALSRGSDEILKIKYANSKRHLNQPVSDSLTGRLMDRLRRSARLSSVEFFELTPWLIFGSALVAVSHILMPSVSYVKLAADPVGTMFLLQLTSFFQGLGSIELALHSKPLMAYIPFSAVLAYLSFGSMLNLRNLPLMIRMFSLKTVVHMYLIVFLTVSTLCLIISSNFS